MKIIYPPVKIRDVWRIFWQGIRPHLTSLSLAVLGAVIGSVTIIITPLYYRRFFDLVVSSGDRLFLAPQLFHLILLILGLNTVMWLAWRLSGFSDNHFLSRAIPRLRQIAFDRLIHHSHSFFVQNFGGALVQRVNRFANAFERLADRIIYDVLSLGIKIIGISAVAYIIYPFFAWIILFWVVVFLTFNFFFARWKLKYDLRRAESDSATTAMLTDAITNHNTIELFNGHGRENRNFEGATNQQARVTLFTWNLDALVNAIQAGLFFALEFGVFYWAIKYWSLGAITAGTFVLLQIYVLDLGDKVFSFSRIIRDIYQSYADAKEMVQIMKLPPEIQDVPGAVPLRVEEGEIIFDQVNFGFNLERAVLKNIAVTIRAGEKVALVGPSGAGKSTFVKLLLRFHDVKEGAIKIDGQNIKAVTKASLYDAISLVPQDPVLFHRSLRENIRYGRPGASDEDVEQAAKSAHCDEFILQAPDGYDTYVGERGIKLSGGERQRVAIARAILKNAPILVLDEATSSLDSHSEKLIQEALGNLMKGRTTIVIAHRLSTIRQMDRIIVIDGGQIVEQGNHDELTHQNGLYGHLWQLQAGGFLGYKVPFRRPVLTPSSCC